MDAATLDKRTESPQQAPCARIGLIIPSVNTMSEPQFNRFAPPGLARPRRARARRRPMEAAAAGDGGRDRHLGASFCRTARPTSSCSTAPTPR